jgi:hypothetical protein
MIHGSLPGMNVMASGLANFFDRTRDGVFH